MVQSINQAILRIDNVPKGIESKVLKRVEIPKFGDILEYEYLPRSGMPIDKCGFEVSASSETGDVKQIVSLSPHLISMMADYCFSLEIV